MAMTVVKSAKDMSHKSLAAIIIGIVISVLGFYSTQVSGNAAAWMGIVIFALMAILQIPGVASGQLPAGWTVMTILINVSGVLLDINSQIADKALLDPKITNVAYVAINLVILTFLKEYSGVGGVTTISDASLNKAS